jgi:hypothetical protein
VTHYQLWVFLHVASVIVWLGAGTTLVLATLYARRALEQPLLEAVTGDYRAARSARGCVALRCRVGCAPQHVRTVIFDKVA